MIGLALAALLSLALIQPAEANTVYIMDTNGDLRTEGPDRYSASCGAMADSCLSGISVFNGIVGVNSWIGTALPDLGSENDLAVLNGLLAEAGRDSVDSVNHVYAAGNSFSSDSEYFAITNTDWTVFFYNMSGSELTVNFGPTGFSRWAEFDSTPSAVPIPAAIWHFGAAMLGLTMIARRGRSPQHDA